MVSILFKLVPESISQKPIYQKFLRCLRIYSFIASISGTILFIIYLITLGSTLTTAHGIVLTIAILSAVYTAISTVLICFVPSGGNIVDAVRWIFSMLFFLGWGVNTAVLGSETSSCGGGSKKKRNDSDSGSGSCGLLGAVVAVSVLNLLGFFIGSLVEDIPDAEKLKNPLKKQKEASSKATRTGGYEPVDV
ncbi:hypothetical protein BKA61DRAFT_299402 [Leptodontidium sp. MPI-SDFR-AT-0119]|nr:hypothetical protein BKA61DRAFT_299402 [Leptodontidium sp. MPI-SDFR-AT-0119]